MVCGGGRGMGDGMVKVARCLRTESSLVVMEVCVWARLAWFWDKAA